MNIAQNIERGSLLFAEKIALIDANQSYTYKHINDYANRFANALLGLGIHQGDRVALLLPNCAEFVFAYYGTQKIGGIVVSINTSLLESEIRFILQHSGAKAIITTQTLREHVLDHECSELSYSIITGNHNSSDLSFNDLMQQANPKWVSCQMSSSDPAVIVYTSGTTGFPKGATLSHGNVISNMYAKTHYLGIRPEDRLMLCVPLYHCFGQNAILNSGFNSCATVVLYPRFDPESIIPALNRDHITLFFGAPTAFIALCDKLQPADVQTVRYYLSAAAALPVEIEKKWHDKFGLPIYQGYGLTETSPFASYNHFYRYKLGSIGSPIENVEMKIVNIDDGTDLGPNELGEIVIKGPNVMLGYWNSEVDTQAVIKSGWFHTGDIGTMDEEGYFYIADRLKDMIIVGGTNIYPTEVEHILYQHPDIKEAAVYGVPDPLMGESVIATVVLKPNAEKNSSELKNFCEKRLAPLKVPTHFEFGETIPKSPTGKILKRVLRDEKLKQNQNGFSEPIELSLQNAFSIDQIQSWVVSWMSAYVNNSQASIEINQSFSDVGIDSLGVLSLSRELGRWIGLYIDPIAVWNCSTIDHLVRYVFEEIEKRQRI
ncbi:MAG: AMP-binding protein [Desulfobacterales bacterium]|nr:AMP-binding protein [Desulfobacterales bacterium]